MNINREQIEKIVREIVLGADDKNSPKLISVPHISVRECDRLDTGNLSHNVYTRDLLTLEESPRLGCGIMEMTDTTFEWNLSYDEIDYVTDGTLTIIYNGTRITAGKGEIIYIPKNSKIQFSVRGFARFIYVTYPADWQENK